MITRMMSVLLSLSLCINTVFAQELKTENNFDLTEAPMVWSPEKKKIKVGDLEIELWIMPRPNLIAPAAGYLIYRSDFSQMSERLNNLQKRIDAIILSERSDCDVQLKQKDIDCAELNRQLRAKLDARKTKVDDLTLRLKDEEAFSDKLLIGGGITIFALTTAIVITSFSVR